MAPGQGHVDTGHPRSQTPLLPSSVQNKQSTLPVEIIQVMREKSIVTSVQNHAKKLNTDDFPCTLSPWAARRERVALAVTRTENGSLPCKDLVGRCFTCDTF